MDVNYGNLMDLVIPVHKQITPQKNKYRPVRKTNVVIDVEINTPIKISRIEL